MWRCFFGDFTFGLNDVIDKLGCVEEMIKSDLTFNKHVAFENISFKVILKKIYRFKNKRQINEINSNAIHIFFTGTSNLFQLHVSKC